ncbi:MAG: hypothetical protein ABIL70_01885 [candidate division WOR-3 bacterium]
MYENSPPKIIAVFIFFALTAMIFALLSKEVYEEDSITHFLLAKYSFKHPWAFVDIWARPLPTLFHSLPSQFGVMASKIMQILITFLSGLFLLRLGRIIELKYYDQLLVFFFFQPFLFLTSYNILTEPFFALILAIFLYLLYKGKNTLSLLILSFLPLSRPEGYLIFPVVLIYLIIKKIFKLYHPIIMLTGSILWYLGGVLIFSNFRWFILYFPWRGNPGYYGFGGPFDYLTVFPLAISFITLPFLLVGFWKTLNRRFWLIPVAFIIYLSFFSYIWYKGLLRAMLCPRYFAILSPLIAIMLVKGMEVIPEKIGRIILLCYIIISLYIVHIFFPFKTYPDHQTIKEVFYWYEENVNKDAKIICSFPYFYYIARKDPYDFERHPAAKIENVLQLNNDDIVIWDNNFMVRELPIDSLKKSGFEEIKVFKNENNFIVKILKKFQ